MPRPLSWLPLLPAIRRSVSGSVRSHYDRHDLELLFRLQPAAAGKLLDALPTLGVGTSRLVEKDTLSSFLAEASKTDDVPGLLRRMRSDRQARSRRKIRSLARYDLEPVPMAALPSWMQISPGTLVVNFESVQQLAEGMMMLAGILVHELDAFTEAYEPAQPYREEEKQASNEVQRMFAELAKREAQQPKLDTSRTPNLMML